MSYHIYHSDAIVIGAHDHGESDKVILCYSRSHGLVRTHAKSLRLGRSKLRYAVAPFRVATIDFIRGRSGWKLTSAIPGKAFPDIYRSREKRMLVAQQFRLLTRMVHGEERHDALYEHLHDMLHHVEHANYEMLRPLELLHTIRLLAHLGYWGGEYQEYAAGTIDQAMLERAEKDRRELVSLVNSALRMTHL